MSALHYLRHNIGGFVGRVCYEDVGYFLLYSKFPTKNNLDELRSQLTSERKLLEPVIKSVRQIRKTIRSHRKKINTKKMLDTKQVEGKKFRLQNMFGTSVCRNELLHYRFQVFFGSCYWHDAEFFNQHLEYVWRYERW
jgi:citrate synthase